MTCCWSVRRLWRTVLVILMMVFHDRLLWAWLIACALLGLLVSGSRPWFLGLRRSKCAFHTWISCPRMGIWVSSDCEELQGSWVIEEYCISNGQCVGSFVLQPWSFLANQTPSIKFHHVLFPRRDSCTASTPRSRCSSFSESTNHALWKA